MAAEIGSKSNGVAFLVSAGIVYEIIAANCSSPQTAEINAGTRATTLMKWVNIGLIQSAGFVAIAAYIDSERRTPILLGGGLAGLVMYCYYVHAKNSGLANPGPSTEQTYGSANNPG